MKKILILLVIAVALLGGCQKADEYLNSEFLKIKNLGNDYYKSNAEIKLCPILQIRYAFSDGTDDVLEFSYNVSGNPVSSTRRSGGHTGYPNFIFKYDTKNRLSDFVGPYNSNTAAEFWHKYFYDGLGNIILDSTYIFPGITNGFPENAYMRQLTFYTYDNENRIIKDSTVSFDSGSVVTHTYAYNAKGNKTGSRYDNKINVNRTNKIWMFLNRDYSVNNPFNADNYNIAGLPTAFNLPPDGNSLWFLGNVYPKAQIVYKCDALTSK